MGGLSVFCGLPFATRDLLGRVSGDGEHPVYADAIEEAGGIPVLVLVDGEPISDDLGSASVIDADPDTELRIPADQLWSALLGQLAEEFPEDREALRTWERTPEGFRRLWEEFELDSSEALFDTWLAVERRLVGRRRR
jgi:hypothetical protein